MDFLELAEHRQSVRKYLPDPVCRETIEHCISAARLAPSACNSQPWHFVIIDDPELKNAVAANTHGKVVNINHFTNQAPVIVAIISERQLFTAKIGNFVMKKRFTFFDIGIAAEHFCLAAAEKGLGTCMLGWFKEKPIAKLLKVPANRKVELLITVGKAATDKIRQKNRKTTDEIRTYNSYRPGKPGKS
jgi:nitroreductase